MRGIEALDAHLCDVADVQAGARVRTGLVLSAHPLIGHQIAGLFSSGGDWQMQVVGRDKQGYARLSGGGCHAVVADIDAADLGGLALLIYAKRHWPCVTTYAITRNEDAYLKQLACEMAGCQGFFHLSTDGMTLEMHSGMAARLAGPGDGKLIADAAKGDGAMRMEGW